MRIVIVLLAGIFLMTSAVAFDMQLCLQENINRCKEKANAQDSNTESCYQQAKITCSPEPTPKAQAYDWRSCVSQYKEQCRTNCITSEDIDCQPNCERDVSAKCDEEGYSKPGAFDQLLE
jgi:hypothetical protein